MRLNKAQRSDLFAGRPVELTQPASHTPPFHTGRSYKIERADGRVLVARQKRTENGWKVVLTLDRSEPVRYPARGLGYTTYAPMALKGADAAVDAEYQDQLDREARERFEARRTADLAERARAVGLDPQDLLG